MPELTTLPEAARLAGMEYRTLHTWLRRGLFTPSGLVSDGAGTPNLLTKADVRRIVALAALRRAGVEPTALERIVDDPRELTTALTAALRAYRLAADA